MSKDVVVILGPGRSGTSMITSLLKSFGMECGEHRLTTGIQNIAGDFEDIDIANAHLEIMKSLGVHPNLPIDRSIFNSDSINKHIQKLRKILNVKLEKYENKIWGFKDPKTASLLPLWTRVFNKENISPKYILSIRNPADSVVSRSINYMTNEFLAELIWLHRTCDAIIYSHANCFISHYEKWFSDDAISHCDNLLKYLNINNGLHEDHILAIVKEIVKPSLNRSSYVDYEIKNTQVLELYETIKECYEAEFDKNLLMASVKKCKFVMNEYSGWYLEAQKFYKKSIKIESNNYSETKKKKVFFVDKNELLAFKTALYEKQKCTDEKIDAAKEEIIEKNKIIIRKSNVSLRKIDSLSAENIIWKIINDAIYFPIFLYKKIKIKIAFFAKVDSKKEFLFKVGYFLFAPLFKFLERKIWIISERLGESMEENGYCFFKWCTECHPEKDIYYVLNKNVEIPTCFVNSKKVIRRGSFKNFYLVLRASTVFFTNDPRDAACVRSSKFLRNVKTIFLRHGVGIYSNGKYLQREAKNIDVVCCVSEIEKRILSKNLELSNNQNLYVVGQPRFDVLYNNKSAGEYVLFCPTWRYGLDKKSDSQIKNSLYFRKIISLINNEKLNDYLLNKKIKLKVRLHFRMIKFLELLKISGSVELEDIQKINMQKSLLNSKLLITDYSSIMWDIAYMNRPVVLYQFDREEFLEERGKNSFNISEKKLFCSCIFDEESLVDKVIDICRKDFLIENKTKEKINEFFAWRDNLNSKRIYDLANSIKKNNSV